MFTKKNRSSQGSKIPTTKFIGGRRPLENFGKNRTRKIRYVITDYTKRQAKLLGVTIQPSSNPEKKLDVFKDGKKIATCGARGYNDYPTFRKKFGKKIADHHRKLYKQRHEKDRHIVGSNGYYADKLLW
jgi:hypothetical protein